MVVTLFVAVMGVLLPAACSKPQYIAGTRIVSTPENKEIIEVVEEFRRTMIALDVERFIQLAHPNYFQPKTHADGKAYDYKGLVESARLRFAQLKSVRLDIQYRRIQWEKGDRVSVEVYLDGSYQIHVGDEDHWEKKTDYMKLTLEKHEDKWLFVSGL